MRILNNIFIFQSLLSLMRKMLRWENHKNNCFKNNNNCFRLRHLSYFDGIEKIEMTICSQSFYIKTEKIGKLSI